MKKSVELDPLVPRPNLNFSKGVRGKYYDRMQQGSNLILIDADLLDTFPDSKAVNQALRSLKKNVTRSAKASRVSQTTATG